MPRSDSLDHVPRRGVQAAKDLRRMGLEVVRREDLEDKESQNMSSKDVKQVTESARAIADIGRDAQRIKQKLEESVADIRDALGIADQTADALRSAGAELRGVLGAQTNNPPPDEDDAGGAGPAPADSEQNGP